MKDVNPSPAAVGGRFDPTTSPTGPLDKRSNAPPASSVQPSGQPIAYPNPIPAGTAKPVAQGGVY
jgi:hypothetical protein